MTDYYTTLQTISDMAKAIQGAPVPEDEISRRLHLQRLEDVHGSGYGDGYGSGYGYGDGSEYN